MDRREISWAVTWAADLAFSAARAMWGANNRFATIMKQRYLNSDSWFRRTPSTRILTLILVVPGCWNTTTSVFVRLQIRDIDRQKHCIREPIPRENQRFSEVENRHVQRRLVADHGDVPNTPSVHSLRKPQEVSVMQGELYRVSYTYTSAFDLSLHCIIY